VSTPDEVYMAAANAIIARDNDDEDDRLFEWRHCGGCNTDSPCACSGVPWPSESIRAAIDVAYQAGFDAADAISGYEDFVADGPAETIIDPVPEVGPVMSTPDEVTDEEERNSDLSCSEARGFAIESLLAIEQLRRNAADRERGDSEDNHTDIIAKRTRPVVWCDDHEPVGWECGCDQAYDAVETVTIRRVAH
jgi:hypothetical protein